LLLVSACSRHNDTENPPVDISDQFLLATSALETHEPMEVLSGQAGLDFEPLLYPQDIAEFGNDSWLKMNLVATDNSPEASILELPGHLFGQVDIWFELADGQVIHEYAGVRYPYVERKVKHAGVAFNLPPPGPDPVNVLIRIKSEAAMPVNFAALLWSENAWDNYLFNQRAWYGIFLGAILILSIYNIFLAFSLRDKSYLFYVGYILSLTFVVILVSGLAEEYLWPQGKPRSFILMASGLGIFFAVSFVNTFLQLVLALNDFINIGFDLRLYDDAFHSRAANTAIIHRYVHAYSIDTLRYLLYCGFCGQLPDGHQAGPLSCFEHAGLTQRNSYLFSVHPWLHQI